MFFTEDVLNAKNINEVLHNHPGRDGYYLHSGAYLVSLHEASIICMILI